MPFPYSDSARGAVQQPVTHLVQVEAAGRTLDNLKAASITFDEGQNPYVVADLKCVLPEDQSYLDSLDPRTGARLKVWAGYRYQSGVVEAPLIADLVLSDREAVRPDDTLSLSATSRETRLGEAGIIETFRPVADAQRDTHAVVSQIVKLAYPTATIRNEAVRDLYTPSEPLVIEPGDRLLDAVIDLANAGPDLWVYEDGLGIWHVQDRPKIGTAEAILSVGQNGTILSGTTTLSRNDFANAVLIEHRWRPEGATTDRVVRGYAEQTSGPLGTTAAGRTLKVLKRTTPIGLDRATLSAQGVLSRTISRGRGFHLEAVSHLWLRPGDTVTVTMPTGPEERHLVAAVTFDLKSGRMRLVTRQPADRELAEDN